MTPPINQPLPRHFGRNTAHLDPLSADNRFRDARTIDPMDRIGRRYSGRVQGVGFRYTAQSLAQRLRVSGWVRNEPDGSVCLVAVGTHDALAALEQGIDEHLGPGINEIRAFDPSPDQVTPPALSDTPLFEIRQ